MREAGAWSNMVVFQLNYFAAYYAVAARLKSYRAAEDAVVQHPELWRNQFITDMRHLKRYLDSEGVPLLVVLAPDADEISPAESAWTAVLVGKVQPNLAVLRMLQDAIRRSGVPWIDLTDDFSASLRSSRSEPLFETGDPHFAQRARDLTANAVVNEIERMKPWKH